MQLGVAALQQQREPSCGTSSGAGTWLLGRGALSARETARFVSVRSSEVQEGAGRLSTPIFRRKQASVSARAPLVSELRPWPKVLSAQLRPHDAARPSPPPGPAAAAVAVRLPARFMRRMRRTYANAARSAPAASAHLNRGDSNAVET